MPPAPRVIFFGNWRSSRKKSTSIGGGSPGFQTSVWRACWITLLFWPSEALAQDIPPVSVSPTVATMLVGETRPFRAVDDKGHALHGVQWTISEPRLAELSSGDASRDHREGSRQLHAHGSCQRRVCRCPHRSRSSERAARGHDKVESGGPARMSHHKITPAVPSAQGPDVFEQSRCADGTMCKPLPRMAGCFGAGKLTRNHTLRRDRRVLTRHRPRLL